MIEAPTKVPVETVTPIKPSEAIRLGCLIAPQQSTDGWGTGNTACVNRALLLGLGNDRDEAYEDVDRLAAAPAPPCQVPCPKDNVDWLRDKDLSSVLVHLNDDHLWSRERIANWLEAQGL